MALKLKDGHTYVTRSGVKRVVRKRETLSGQFPDFIYCFECASLSQGFKTKDTHKANGRFLSAGKTRFDFVKEFKSNAK